MSLRRTIADSVSRLDFYDEVGPPNAGSFFSFVRWSVPRIPDLIRPQDFTDEFIDNAMGGILEGRYPPAVNWRKIIGFTPVCDGMPSDSNDPRFFGGRVSDCMNPGGDPLKVQIASSRVNEFYSPTGENQDKGDRIMGVSSMYALDGLGNITVEVAALCNGKTIAPCIQNPHMVELCEEPTLDSFDVHIGQKGQKEGYNSPTKVLRLPPEFLFEQRALAPLKPLTGTFLLQDTEPKSFYALNDSFLLSAESSWWYLASRSWWYLVSRFSEPLWPIIGVSRRRDGAGVLMVHGNLPRLSQPLILFNPTPTGVIPILSSLAYCGFQDKSTTVFKLHFLPFTRETYEAQCALAVSLCDYANPIYVRPW